MRRIVIGQLGDDVWAFDRLNDAPVSASSPLRAAIAAMEYGESLRGTTALGYIIRLNHPGANAPEDMLTLHVEVF